MGIFGSGTKQARAEALRRGVLVEAVEREVPIFHHLSTRFSHLERASCMRYSMPRQDPGRPNRWSFLQRDTASGAQYENGWCFESPEGPPGAFLEGVLIRIANEWSEEYLEFEADSTSMHAYWNEFGGSETAGLIVDWLEALAGARAAA